jgi:membrane protease YdiL (CAAX protease family)
MTAEEQSLETVSTAASWEDDETRASLFLRAAIVLTAGAFLLWTQRAAPFKAGDDWARWIWAAVLCNFILPLGLIWLLFGQGLSHLDWLQNQKHNAWNYGWNFGLKNRAWQKHFKMAGAIFLVMLPFLWWQSRVPEVRDFYRAFYPAAPTGSTPALLALLTTSVLYMLFWEWFFRGFLLFGMAQGFGFFVAIALQAALFGMAHWGKPPLELYSSFAGGLVLGVLCWREKSFAPAFYAHALIHVAWILFIFN